MRKVIAEIAVSLDGYIEGERGELDWMIFDEQPSFVTEFLSRFDVIFYGRSAYERLGMFHPRPAMNAEEQEFYEIIRSKRKYVFSRQVKHVPGNAMVVNSRIRQNVNRIKAEEGKDIWLFGGGQIISTFAMLDLIDEYVLAVQPVILGAGKRLFRNLGRNIKLELLNAERLSSGVVVLNYRPHAAAGENCTAVIRQLLQSTN